jgi:MFS family permease
MHGPLGYAPYRWLFGARTISFLGNAIAPFALAFAVLDLTGSTTDLGIVVGTRSATNVALLLLGGVIADRLPRHLVLVGSSAAAAVTQGAVAALVLTHSATVLSLALLGALNGAVSAMNFPASAALTPQTVPPELLQAANTWLRLGRNATGILGAALAGVLVAALGPGWGIAIDAASFAVAALMYGRIGLTRAPDSRETTSVLTELREGWGEFVSRTWVWVVVLQFMIVNAALTGALGVLGPAVANLHFGRRDWGLMLAAEAVGLVAGGVIALHFRPRRALLFGVVCTLVEAVPIAVLGIAPRVLLLIPLFFVAGIGLEQFGIAWDVSVQQHVPTVLLARVYSYDALGSLIAIPVGEVLVGPIANHVGLRATLVGCASAVVIATAGALLSPSVRGLRRLADVPAGA